MAWTGTPPQIVGGLYPSSSEIYYPKVYNIEMDPHEDVNLGGVYIWATKFGFKPVKDYLESIKKYPNPPAANITNFRAK